MADPCGISGIRAAWLRLVAILKKDNYRAWSTKLKVELKVMDCWLPVTGAELQLPATAPAGADAAAVTAALNLRKSWDRRNDAASAVLITSISDEQLHTVHGRTRTLRKFGSDFGKKSSAVPKLKRRQPSCISLILRIWNQRQLMS